MATTPDWDRTRPWELLARRVNQASLAIEFSQSPPPVAEPMALRKLLPEYANMPPAELKRRVHEHAILDLGVHSYLGCEQLVRRAEELGLAIQRRDCSFTAYLPYDRTAGTVMRICDEEVARRVEESMMREEVPVVWISEKC